MLSGGPTLADSVQLELTNLSQDARPKFPHVKEAAERAILRLRSLHEQQPPPPSKDASSAAASAMPQAIGRAKDVLTPLLLALDTRHPRLMLHAVGILHKLSCHNAVAVSSVGVVTAKLAATVGALESAASAGGPDAETAQAVELRVLQTLAALVSTLPDLHGRDLSQVLTLCLRVHVATRNAVVASSAAFTMRQLLTLLFDRASVEAAELSDAEPPAAAAATVLPAAPSTNAALGPGALDAYLLLQDLVSLTGGDRATWLELDGVSERLALELLEEVLVGHASLLTALPDFFGLSRDRLCPLLIKLLSSASSLGLSLSSSSSSSSPSSSTPSSSVASGPSAGVGGLLLSHSSARQLQASGSGLQQAAGSAGGGSGGEFGSCVRLMRIVSVLVSRLHGPRMVPECEVFVARLVRLLDPHHALWCQALALEVLRGLVCDSPQLLRRLYADYDLQAVAASGSGGSIETAAGSLAAGRLVHNVVGALAQFVQTMFDWTALARDGRSLSMSAAAARQPRYLDMLSLPAAPPAINEAYVVSLGVECLSGVVAALDELAEGGDTLAGPMAASCWPAIESALGALLERCQDDTLLLGMLATCRTLLHATAVLGLGRARDACLGSLCRLAVPRPLLPAPSALLDVDRLFSSKHIMIINTLLDVAGRMGNMLEVSGWQLLVDTFQQLDLLFHSPRTLPASGAAGQQQQHGQAAAQPAAPPSQQQQADLPLPPSALALELNSCMAAIDALFTHTRQQHAGLSEDGVRWLMAALCRVSADTLHALQLLLLPHRDPPHPAAAAAAHGQPHREPTTPSTSTAAAQQQVSAGAGAVGGVGGVGGQQQRAALYAANKALEVALHDTMRLTCWWPTLFDHFSAICGSRDATLRSFGVEAFTRIISEALSAKPSSAADTTVAVCSSGPPLALQDELLETLSVLALSAQVDTRERSLHALYHVLQASGQALTTAWPCVLHIVMTVAVNSDRPMLVALAFKSVQLICSDFLPNLSVECVQLYTTALGCYAGQSADLNISLTAVNLLWHVADFLAKLLLLPAPAPSPSSPAAAVALPPPPPPLSFAPSAATAASRRTRQVLASGMQLLQSSPPVRPPLPSPQPRRSSLLPQSPAASPHLPRALSSSSSSALVSPMPAAAAAASSEAPLPPAAMADRVGQAVDASTPAATDTTTTATTSRTPPRSPPRSSAGVQRAGSSGSTRDAASGLSRSASAVEALIDGFIDAAVVRAVAVQAAAGQGQGQPAAAALSARLQPPAPVVLPAAAAALDPACGYAAMRLH
eukprot:TRINITY_DN2181_c0_g2_i3.p1 TRINITY_DN2181_c0_g2~~TRINITY_DN2181_c0_g2_i3.p1  ORF type:complete len:1280 (+),score=527.19 TRINITY_DN2181_c0_g2_i3:1522-5361(+)